MNAAAMAIQALLAQPGVTAITSTRIQLNPLKQGTVLPAIAVALTAEDEAMLLAGSSQYPESSVQLHCLATNAGDAVLLGEAVKIALRDLSYTWAGPPSTHASFAKEPIDFTDFTDDRSTHRRVMSFAIRWR